MKSSSEYVRRVKRLFNKLRRESPKIKTPEPTDPLEQLTVGILSRGTTLARAKAALRKLQSAFVDFNEIRVTRPREIVEVLGERFPLAREKAEALTRIYGQIFNREHKMSLNCLTQMGKREARAYLEQLDGIDQHTVAMVMLMSLQAHAIPVDEQMAEVLKQEQLVDADAGLAEIQGFLERHISASQGYEFYVLMRRYIEARRSRRRRRALE